MPTLVVQYKDGSRAYPLREGVPVFIGRAKECDIHLPSPAVSRRHAVVMYKNGICGVKDLDSFNGTLVNGQAIDSARHLTDADAVTISSFVIRLDASDIAPLLPPPAASAPGKSGTAILAESEVREGLDAAADMPTDPAPEEPARQESHTFPKSTILLPRAMTPDVDDVEEMLENLRRAGALSSAAPDTAAGIPEPAPSEQEPEKDGGDGAARAPSPDAPVGDSEATVELNFPTEYARSLAQEAQEDVESIMPEPAPGRRRESSSPFPTEYFREDPDASGEEAGGGAAGKSAPPAPKPAAKELSEAERIIPLNEPERAPRLTLEWDDDATNRALEALVADVSQAVTMRRRKQAADTRRAVSGGDGDPAFSAFSAGAAGRESAAEHPGAVVAAEPADAPSEADATDGAYTRIYRSDDDGAAAYDTISVALPYSPESARTAVPGVAPVVITPSFMAAINARLALYPLLLKLAEERRAFREENPNLSPEVEAELDRQDAELNSLPGAEEADRMLKALAGRRAGTGNEALRRAEDMAEAQWLLVRDSSREALPAVYREAYKLAADEPLARELAAERIHHGRLFGGAVYLLALEVVAETAREARRDIAERIRRLAGKDPEKDESGIFRRLGHTVRRVRNRTEIREKTQSLEVLDQEHAVVEERAMRESAFIEKAMGREFRQTYVQTAARFGASGNMPLSVRAFLRFGAIGFKPWWMRPEIGEFIRNDCRDNIVRTVEIGPGTTAVLYADECLAAVAAMECPPFPDESIAGYDRDSEERKTERAFRRTVNARSYSILMDDMLTRLDATLREYADESADIARRITELREWSSGDNADELLGLETELQVIAIRRDNLEQHIKRIETEVVASILESVEDAERRFRQGELIMPDAAALAAKEGVSLALMARRIGGPAPRFMPLALRELASPAGLNDRKSVAARLADVEKRDPGVFVSTIIPAKKKENRVELRLSPVVVIFPCCGVRGVFATPRDGMEGGHLVVPMSFSKKDVAEAVYAGLLADFRWETSRLLGGEDVENSDTLAGAFLRFRREWKDEPLQRREKGFIFNELTDKRNWRRVYAAFLSDAANSTRRLHARNPALYESVIEPYVE